MLLCLNEISKHPSDPLLKDVDSLAQGRSGRAIAPRAREVVFGTFDDGPQCPRRKERSLAEVGVREPAKRVGIEDEIRRRVVEEGLERKSRSDLDHTWRRDNTAARTIVRERT